MALHVKQIISRNLMDGAEIVAGIKGKDNEVLWINIMEILDYPDSVQRGELLITTGYRLNDEASHRYLIANLKERGVSGLAIQLDYYISKIPQYIIKEANELNFPILTIPSRLTFSSIMHTLLTEIMSDEYISPTERMDILFKKMKTKIEEEKIDLNNSSENFLFLIKQNKNDLKRTYKEEVESALGNIRSFLETQPASKCFFVEENKNAAFLLQLPKKKAQQNIVFELTILLTFISEQQNINFFVGVDMVKKNEEVETAFEHDMECVRVLQDIGAKRGVAPYNNLTFFELFSTLHRNNSSMLLGNDAIQSLLSYDNKHDTAYVQTLRVYLAYGCNTSKTAERLFIHRHTLMNRLSKIEDMCEISLEDYYTRTYMSLALVVHDYFAL
jgi:hypothetical protein